MTAKHPVPEEIQKRRCKICDRQYDYPVAKSLATRFVCEDCVQIPSPVQRVLEQQMRRIKALEKGNKEAG